MPYTARNAATDALRDIGAIDASETPTAEDAAFALDRLNMLADSWKTEGLMLYALRQTEFALTPSKASYTIGTSGTPDVSIEVPSDIGLASFGLRDASYSPALDLPFRRILDEEWMAISQKTQESTLPIGWWWNNTVPNGTLTLWPIPTQTSLKGVIQARYGAGEFTLDSVLELPAGYRLMIVKAVAAGIAPAFGRAELASMLKAEASDAKANVKRRNRQLVELEIPDFTSTSYSGRYGGNILTGP